MPGFHPYSKRNVPANADVNPENCVRDVPVGRLRIEDPHGQVSEVNIDTLPCRIGRHRQCEVVLPSWRVARVHAEIRRDGSYLSIVDHGSLSGTWIDGARIVEFSPLTSAEHIDIGSFRLFLLPVGTPVAGAADTLSGENGNGAGVPPLHDQSRPANASTNIVDPGLDTVTVSAARPVAGAGSQVALRRQLHQLLLDSMDLRRQEIRHLDTGHLRDRARTHLIQLLADNRLPALDDMARLAEDARADLIEMVLDEAVGLGVLERLLSDPEISEIMVNGCAAVFTERNGCLENTGLRFSSDEAIQAVIERIVSPLGRRIDEASPMVDARLPDGSRVNAVIPPLSVTGPCITIRRFNKRRFKPEEMVGAGSLSAAMLDFLAWCVESRLNVVVSGGTGSGKTTLLNLLSQHIAPSERIITIEDAAELQLSHPNLVTLEARPANAEGSGRVSIRDLVRNALRMRPDRIIVGECRGGEALDMLQAMNTGHNGSLTTVHANSARDALSRLEVMVLMSGIDVPVQAIREQIASAVDIIVQQQRSRDGRRRVVQISEVTGMEGARIQTQDLFVLHATGNMFVRAANVPVAFDRLDIPAGSAVRRLFEETADAVA